MATFADFKARYPELITDNDGNQTTVQSCLDEAVVVINLQRCPKISDNLQLAYAAHCVAKLSDNPQGANVGSGTVTSESVGSVSISYSSSDSRGEISDWYRSTQYGQDFLRLQKMCFGAAILTAP